MTRDLQCRLTFPTAPSTLANPLPCGFSINTKDTGRHFPDTDPAWYLKLYLKQVDRA